MTRPRGSSAASDDSAGTGDQELGSMYDYLAKVILLGPSGTGKSCLLHRFVKSEWRVLSSQTIGVEFSSKIIKVGTGSRRKRIKLQLWDTAGTERFRSVSRSYYRGAAGAILVYDMTSHPTFRGLQPFLNDARALASPKLSVLLVGNKVDLASPQQQPPHSSSLADSSAPPLTPSSYGSAYTTLRPAASSTSLSTITTNESSGTIRGRNTESRGGGTGGGGGGWNTNPGSYNSGMGIPMSGASAGLGHATVAPEGREVSSAEASRWASTVGIPVVMEASAFTGENVDEIFGRLARMILTKIELGEVDPDDPMSGIQYGDAYGSGRWDGGTSDGASVKSSMTGDDGRAAGGRRRPNRYGRSRGGNWGGLREWEEVFTLSARRRGGGCC